MDIFSTFDDRYPSMSKGHKKITDYIRENIDEAAFMTAAKLGKCVGVSESTVVRYAMSLGYEGYPELQDALSQVVKGRLSVMDRMDMQYGKSSRSELITSVLMADMARINETLELVDVDAFETAMELICSARNVYVVGIRQEAPLAAFLSFYLNIMFGNVHLVQTSSVNEIFEQMIRVDSKDVVIGISFPRYSVRALKALEFANSRSASVIAITDDVHSPMNMYSAVNLFAKSSSVSIVDSLVAPLSLVNALIVGLCMKKKREVFENLHTLEEIWADYQVYGSDEMDFLDEDKLRTLE